jgi:hypothetical protein
MNMMFICVDFAVASSIVTWLTDVSEYIIYFRRK